MKLSYLQLNAIEACGTGNLPDIRRSFLASSGKKAIIIGAGPSGLAAGISLKARGWHVLILEQRPSFTRDTVVGINKAALGWFEQHNLLDALLGNSSKTAFYPTEQHFPKDKGLLDAKLWLNDTANTTNTISTKILQKVLYEKYIAAGGMLLSNISVQLNPDHVYANDWQIFFNDVDLVIGAYGANVAQQAKEFQDYSDIPTQHFANVIIDKKPENLSNGIYFHIDEKSKYSAAISVSDIDISLNFQTDAIAEESAGATAQRIAAEAAMHMRNFLHTDNLQLPTDCVYYPINGGKIKPDFRFNKMIVCAPSRYAKQMIYADKFILIGDAKGVSSPRAGLGASLGVAYDATVIDLFAKEYEHTSDKHELFSRTADRLKRSIDIWAQKTMIKLGINSAEQHSNHYSFWQQQPKALSQQSYAPSFEGKP